MDDVVVVGGGLAGAATAGFLARTGLRVTVLDRAEFPRAKACGEGLLPPGVGVLDRLGVRMPPAARLSGIRFHAGGRSAGVPFPQGHGLAVPRRELDEAVRARAAELGAVFRRARVVGVSPGPEFDAPNRAGRVDTDQGVFPARFLIGADGVRSVLHHSLGLRATPAAARVGFSSHWSGVRAEPGVVAVLTFPGGELYLAPVGDGGRCSAALLVNRSLGLDKAAVPDFLRARFPFLFRDAACLGPVLGSYPLATRVDRVAGPGWLLVGDAAGAVDPITGEGMRLALQGAELAGEAVLGWLEAQTSGSRPKADVVLTNYSRRLRRLKRPVERLTAGMLFLSRRPALARIALAREQRLAPFMGVAIGQSGWLARVAGL